MARTKKYRNIKLEQTELIPSAIGMMDIRKKSSIIGTIFILGIFIGAVFFMPEISQYIDNYLHPTASSNISGGGNTTDKEFEKPTIDEDIYIAYEENMIIKNDDITLSKLIIDSDSSMISYDITNNLTKSQNIEDLNYYLEIFNSEGTMVERVKLVNDLVLNSGAVNNVKRYISSDTAGVVSYISLVKKTEADYQDVDLKLSEDGTGILVCKLGHEEVTYKFDGNSLKEVVSVLSYVITDEDYENSYEVNKLNANNYNNRMGVSSILYEYAGGYNITTSVSLNEANRFYIFNADSFKLGSLAKTVKFQMEAQRFICE